MAGQNWAVSGDGGYLANTKLSKKMRETAQPMMKWAQFVRPEPAYGKQQGDTLEFDRVSNVATQGSTILETSSMPETKVTITKGSVVVAEYGNSVPYTGKLEALSEFNVNNLVQKALMQDQAKTLDKAIGDEFKTCQIKYTPTGSSSSPTATLATNGTCATAATRNTSTYDVKYIVDYMKSSLYAPTFAGGGPKNGYYICVASTGFLRGIKDDPDFISAVTYGRPEDLYYGEVGMYEGVRFVEQVYNMYNTLNSSYKGEAVFFGDDAIVEAVAIAPEIRAKIPTDYGRSKGVAWYGMLGYSLTWDTATAGQARIVHVTSTGTNS